MRPDKSRMLADLGGMLRDVFAARAAGTAQPRLARAHGYVDGYMRALLETQIASRQELLDIVARERAAVFGPALSETSSCPDAPPRATAA